ncbi:hypothetical protein G4H71_09035 [Rhodococcus triatomae]|uniref:Lipoprotein n=1 Tax=Rhodococcus triatomae TaxID=300028 RepID=A0A1G8I1E0_9NOCA|nr:LppA family lipoprotein [Rhodococcus triatomae]QNG20928.1 hypothetical protein G4H72_21350 [Rhodococcus triatomae]QNG23157.1 hypothetical protein G4H71_09035 [Rhodococcus triatomae]SDI12703.1 Lipoprotein [Rhodococcus triatomae]
MSWEEHKQVKFEQNMGLLVQRPSLEEIEARYAAMQEEMKASVVAVAPQVEWSTSDEVRQGLCSGELSGSRATEIKFPTWMWMWTSADQEWPAMLDAVSSVASRYGFTDPNTVAGQSGNRDVRLYDEFGGQVRFGYNVNLTLSVHSGCHVRQEAKDRFLSGDTSAPSYGGDRTPPSG